MLCNDLSLALSLCQMMSQRKPKPILPTGWNLLLRSMLTSPEHTPQAPERRLSPKCKCLLRTQLQTEGRGSLTIPGSLTTRTLQPPEYCQQSNLLTGSQHRVRFLCLFSHRMMVQRLLSPLMIICCESNHECRTILWEVIRSGGRRHQSNPTPSCCGN